MTSVRPSRLLALLTVLASSACEVTPTAPSGDPVRPGDPEPTTWATDEGTGLVSDLLVAVDPARLRLEPDADRVDGIYRFRILDEAAAGLRPGEILYGRSEGGTYLRRVLAAERERDLLTVRTGTAFAHEVIRGGSYGLSGAVADGTLESGASGSATAPATFDATFDVGGTDVCALVETQLGRAVCGGEERTLVEKGVVELEGRIDSVKVDSGTVAVTVEVDAVYSVDPGGDIVPNTGRAPVFSPCDAYPNVSGCFARVGDALRSFLLLWGIDPNVLPPLRMCVPGTPIVVVPGSWWPYRAPVVRICRITDWGEVPLFSDPSLTEATLVLRPRVDSDVVISVAASGTVKLTIPVPKLAVTKCIDHGNGFACLKIGLVIVADIGTRGTGGSFRLEDLTKKELTLRWSETDGWAPHVRGLERDHNFTALAFDAPDSITARVGPAVLLDAGICFGAREGTSCVDQSDPDEDDDRGLLDLVLGVNGKAQLGFYNSMTGATDSDFGNWHLPVERYSSIELEAGLTLPKILLQPDKNLSKGWELEWGRVTMGSYHGTGALDVVVSTTGNAPDPDGYTVTVSRADTLPNITPLGSQRLGPASWEHPLEGTVEPTGALRFFPYPACRVVYSDAIAALGGLLNPFAVVQGARRRGVDIPNYFATAGCWLLVADYEVELSGVADHCVVEGGTVHDVRLKPYFFWDDSGATTHRFDVDCPTPTDPPGTLEVTIATSGTNLDEDGYALRLDGGTPEPVAIDEIKTLSGLTARADRRLELLGVADNCVVAGENPASVDVVSGAAVPVRFDVECFPIALPLNLPGRVRVVTSTTGASIDPDGFTVSLDGGDGVHVEANGEVLFDPVQKGRHLLWLSGIANNCAVAGEVSVSVQVQNDQTAEVPFAVTCTATDLGDRNGSVEVTVSTTGPNPDPDGYVLRVGSLAGRVEANGSVILDRVAEGEASVRLDDVAPQCTVEGENPLTVPVGAQDTTRVAMAVSCTDEARVSVSVATSGADIDPDGYVLLLDDDDHGPIGVVDERTLGPIVPGTHYVALGELAPNCGVLADNPTSFEGVAGQVVPVAFSVDCVPLASLGALDVTVRVAGPGGSAAGLGVVVDGTERAVLGASGTTAVSSLRPGPHVVELNGLAEGCRVTGQHPRTILLPEGRSLRTTFVVACARP